MLIRRLVANFIDLFVLLGGTVGGIYVGGVMNGWFEEPFFLLTLSQVCLIILVPILFQTPFWLESKTIGKTMTYLKVVNEKNSENLDYFSMFTREYLAKVLSCYFVCIPLLFGKRGVHEIITYSHVNLNYKKKKGDKQ